MNLRPQSPQFSQNNETSLCSYVFSLFKLIPKDISHAKLPQLPLSKQQPFICRNRVNIFDKKKNLTRIEPEIICLNSSVIEGIISIGFQLSSFGKSLLPSFVGRRNNGLGHYHAKCCYC